MTDTHPDVLRAVAEQVATDAAAFVLRRRAEIFGPGSADMPEPAVRSKSGPTDPVTVVDTETEQLIRRRLAQLRPGEPILGEEGGCGDGGCGEDVPPGAVRWVVDPIDGTVNFVYGLPAYAVSVAAQVDGRSVAGAVADVCGGEVYSAAAGMGAGVSRGGSRQRLECSAEGRLPLALVATGFAYDEGRRSAQASLLAHLLPLVRDVRRFGSAALDLCLVAAGRVDAYYEHGLNVWDWAAGALIAAEAGAEVSLPGAPGGLVFAAAPGVAAELRAALDRFVGPGDQQVVL